MGVLLRRRCNSEVRLIGDKLGTFDDSRLGGEIHVMQNEEVFYFVLELCHNYAYACIEILIKSDDVQL